MIDVRIDDVLPQNYIEKKQFVSPPLFFTVHVHVNRISLICPDLLFVLFIFCLDYDFDNTSVYFFSLLIKQRMHPSCIYYMKKDQNTHIIYNYKINIKTELYKNI